LLTPGIAGAYPAAIPTAHTAAHVTKQPGASARSHPALQSHRSHGRHLEAPARPRRLQVVKVSRNSFSVSVRTHARKYRLFASTDHHKMAVARIKRAHASHYSHRPMMTLRNLHYTTDPYYFRVEARNGSKRKFSSTIGAVGLTPLAPSNLVATTGLSGTSLSWTAGAATGFQVTQATNSAMTQNVRTYTIQNEDHQFTPPNLTVATPYYFQVRALNGETPSTTTSVIQTLDVTQQQPLRVMSYNLLEISADGRFEGGTRVAPWSQRRAGQV
jgi:hypothetical protein